MPIELEEMEDAMGGTKVRAEVARKVEVDKSRVALFISSEFIGVKRGWGKEKLKC